MKYSHWALYTFAAVHLNRIKSNHDFWKNFSSKAHFKSTIMSDEAIQQRAHDLAEELTSTDDSYGIVCIFDDEFPSINSKVKRNKEKPFLLFYEGDIALLQDLNQNVAVIGTLDPAPALIKREERFVRELVKLEQHIVSGLALGCDAVAHKACIAQGGKTIAILPTTINKIAPAANRDLAKAIVESGGLLLTEYYCEPASRYEAINRYVERDRLQAMFAKAVILSASYRKNEGDSGSRHALEAAYQYGLPRYVMYNEEIDAKDPQMAMNKDLLLLKDGSTKQLLGTSPMEISTYQSPYISAKKCEQEQLF